MALLASLSLSCSKESGGSMLRAWPLAQPRKPRETNYHLLSLSHSLCAVNEKDCRCNYRCEPSIGRSVVVIVSLITHSKSPAANGLVAENFSAVPMQPRKGHHRMNASVRSETQCGRETTLGPSIDKREIDDIIDDTAHDVRDFSWRELVSSTSLKIRRSAHFQ
jgi:hypothetical protein